MKLSIINKSLVILGILVLATGIILHVGYPTMMHDHAALTFWITAHIVCAVLITIAFVFHVIKNKWWFQSLAAKLKSTRMLMQRIFTTLTLLLFLSLIVTGVCIVFGWHSAHSHIWIWHYILGLIWAAAAVCHALAFRRPRH